MDILDREKLIKYQQKYENSTNQDLNLLSSTGVRWTEVLESEFDKRFLDLDLFLNQLIDNTDDKLNDNLNHAKTTLNEISSIFSQLIHKCLLSFDDNCKLEKQLDNIKKDLKFLRTENNLLENKLKSNKQQNELINFNTNNFNSLNSRHLNNGFRSNKNRIMSLSNVSRSSSNLFNLKYDYSLNQSNEQNFSEIYLEEEIRNLRSDNISLKKLNISLKSELFGARLAIKYLNKELSGRIQQIQILSKSDLTKLDQSRLWNQIESEILLSRHKTVIKACRGRDQIVLGQKPDSPCDFHNSKKTNGICEVRQILINKSDNEGLGISITGGKEYGLPIIISEIHRRTPAARCGKLYIGDSILSVNGIDLNDVKHTEAAAILLNQAGNCQLECVFVLPEDLDFEISNEQDSCSSRYCYFDSRVMYNNEQNEEQKLTNNKFSDLIEFKKNRNSDSDIDDNLSSITDTFSSPNKLYPGIAKPLASLFKPATITKTKNFIKEEDEILELESDDLNYDKVKLQTLDGRDCQIFYKNKSTII